MKMTSLEQERNHHEMAKYKVAWMYYHKNGRYRQY